MIHIVFDIGNVLIQWDEHAAFRDVFADVAEIDRFFSDVGFYAWNAEQDRGRSRADALAAAPEHAELLDRIFERFADTIQHKVEGSWEVLNDLKARGHRVFGLTNWGAETWPVANDVHAELRDAFEDVVVSGHEKLIKPDRRIYEVLTARNDLVPGECLFIDDSPKNVDGAREAGWQALHFTGADALRAELEALRLL
ncbi:HAD family hydrolase [Boseongicola aestuarii]|uniref:Alpha-D-glucose-1-phosphate phosphatase YihX n=1 Tax=Boseongicola aestuarii TaxID=1470561 RepID=A0A238J2K0_9RHOB|nr:HAD family phosphatase [Boseongicola aestuarii]SMX24180.1 Alpha-D-glucose-1-phosphate phosphatase YihX [Boseongicola aestuarii]